MLAIDDGGGWHGGGGSGGGGGGVPAAGSVIVRTIRRPASRQLPRLSGVGVAIIAESAIFSRGRSKRRPEVMVEQRRADRITSKTSRGQINSAKSGAQTAFTGDRSKTTFWPSSAVKLVVT